MPSTHHSLRVCVYALVLTSPTKNIAQLPVESIAKAAHLNAQLLLRSIFCVKERDESCGLKLSNDDDYISA
jgi:hypothetical protein